MLLCLMGKTHIHGQPVERTARRNAGSIEKNQSTILVGRDCAYLGLSKVDTVLTMIHDGVELAHEDTKCM